ncbi:MAG: protein phosphatase 2C domain-containing protein [Thermodesulfobacteriota bacterium]
METVTRTNIGPERQINQDRLLATRTGPSGYLLAIGDGLGGNPGGETAAELFIENVVKDLTDKDNLSPVQLLLNANQAIINHGLHHPEIAAMGSTATLAALREKQLLWAHIGDSRLYILDPNGLRQITRDQTLARSLYEEGKIDRHEIPSHSLNHFLEQCLGEDDIEPDQGACEVNSGDLFLLCTDGLHDVVVDQQLEKILTGKSSLTNKADILIQTALDSGSKDNISLILHLV